MHGPHGDDSTVLLIVRRADPRTHRPVRYAPGQRQPPVNVSPPPSRLTCLVVIKFLLLWLNVLPATKGNAV